MIVAILSAIGYVSGLLALVIGIVAFGGSLIRAHRTMNYEWPDRLAELVASLFLIGFGAKFIGWMPEFLQFYLSDIGMPVAISVVICFVHWLIGEYNPRPTDNWFRDAYLMGKFRRNSLFIGLFASYGYEIITDYIRQKWSDPAIAFVGQFDWTDIVMYTIGALIGFDLLVWRSQALDRQFDRMRDVGRDAHDDRPASTIIVRGKE